MKKERMGRRGFLKSTMTTGAALGALGVGEAVLAAGERGKKSAPDVGAGSRVPLKELGSTGVKVPILIQGTSQRIDPRYDRILHRLFREGAYAIDTALSYGWGASQRAVSNFVHQIGDRRKVWLTSKSQEESPRRFVQDVDNALRELETDYLDLYLMHGINSLDLLEPPMLKAGEKLRKMGKTRFFGFSCHGRRVVSLMNRAAEVGGVDAILFRYNFRRYGDLELNRAIDACKKAGIGLLAMKTNGSVPEQAEKVLAFKSDRFTLDQAKLKFVWSDERIDTVVSEMDSLRVTRENVAAAKSEFRLAAEEMQQLNRLAALTAHLACNGCADHCEGAVGGALRIADTMRFLMYYEAYGDKGRASALYRAMPPQERDFEGIDPARVAAATAACPQGIDIAGRLHTARRLLEG